MSLKKNLKSSQYLLRNDVELVILTTRPSRSWKNAVQLNDTNGRLTHKFGPMTLI